MIWEKVIVDGKLYYKNDLKFLRYFEYVNEYGTKYNFEVNMRNQFVNIRWDGTNIDTKFEFLVDDHEGCMGFFESKKMARFLFWMRINLEIQFMFFPSNWKHRNYFNKFRLFSKKRSQ